MHNTAEKRRDDKGPRIMERARRRSCLSSGSGSQIIGVGAGSMRLQTLNRNCMVRSEALSLCSWPLSQLDVLGGASVAETLGLGNSGGRRAMKSLQRIVAPGARSSQA